MTPVALVGAGVVGLCSAVRVLERGLGVTIYARRRPQPPETPWASPGPGLASIAAPALFTPYVGADLDRLMRWCRRSLETYEHLARDPDQTGVSLRPLHEYCYARPEPAPFDDLLQTQALEPIPPGCAYARRTLRPHMLTARLLPWLERTIATLGGVFVEREVTQLHSLFDAGHRIVINCSGVGAAQLAGDALVRPMSGQVLHVPNTLGLKHSVQDDARNPSAAGNATYVFCYDDRLVLGSTLHEHAWDERPDPRAERDILDRCRNLLCLDGHPDGQRLGADAPVLARVVGLRPGRGPGALREVPRVEMIRHADGRRGIIHNYGHGRSGVTLAWGCADDVASWARELVNA